MITEECQVCKKELKGVFYWVSCKFFNYHPISECGECMYPVGSGCVKRIPKKFVIRKTNIDEWYDEQEKMNEEAEE